MRILVTGCAGFIGYHLCLKLLNDKANKVFGIDNINNYYDINLKKKRLSNLKKKFKKYIFYKKDICDLNFLQNNFLKNKYDIVVNLAAQAGVKYSIDNPKVYIESNIFGFFNILEVSRINKIKHLIYASTSSVYGSNNNFPLQEDADTNHPLSFYAATKKSNEVMAHSYSNIYDLPCTGVRLFTVYGPYGRPDMSLFKFTKAILDSKKVNLFNFGKHIRGFTYIDDATNAIVQLINKPSRKKIPYSIYNIASSRPQNLKFFLKTIEKVLGKKAKIQYKKLQPGDVNKTYASIKLLQKKVDFVPNTDIQQGIENFINWYKENKK